MIVHPEFDPVALAIGPLAIRWYALSYLLGFLLFIILGRRRIGQGLSVLTKTQLDDLLTYGILGVILGGRLGYVVFYQWAYYSHHLGDILKVWQGGMSFHGGFLGAAFAVWLFAMRHKISFLALSDTVVPLVPLGLASGRMGNFINGELWGRVTSPDAWWAMGFPQAWREDINVLPSLSESMFQFYEIHHLLPRHPSQLYEFLTEGILTFIIVWWFSKKKRPSGQVSAVFLMSYGGLRFLVEFTRQPDDFLGLLSLGLSMGQWLCIPMFIFGLVLFIVKNPRKSSSAKPL